MVMRFMGKSEEGFKIWEQLLAILLDQQVGTPSRCSTDDLSEMASHENRRKELKIRVSRVCNSLVQAPLASGTLQQSLENHKQTSEMTRAIHGHDNSHSDIAMCLNNLDTGYYAMSNFEESLYNLEQSLKK